MTTNHAIKEAVDVLDAFYKKHSKEAMSWVLSIGDLEFVYIRIAKTAKGGKYIIRIDWNNDVDAMIIQCDKRFKVKKKGGIQSRPMSRNVLMKVLDGADNIEIDLDFRSNVYEVFRVFSLGDCFSYALKLKAGGVDVLLDDKFAEVNDMKRLVPLFERDVFVYFYNMNGVQKVKTFKKK